MPFLRIAPICNGKIYVAPAVIKVKNPASWTYLWKTDIYACKTEYG